MRVHLVDGTFELYRAHYSQRPGRTAVLDGETRDIKATSGLVASMLALLVDPDERVTHLAIAFDNPIVSFRNDLFAAYKTDEGVPSALRRQFDLAEEAMRAVGIVVWSMARHEADDALATAAVRFAAMPEVEQVRILTPDKDLGQVVVGERIVQIDRMRRKTMDEAVVRATRGIDPASIPDWLGLVGDTADGIPGLAGFGAKSAAILLSHYKTIENIPDEADRWAVKVTGAPRLAATLAAERNDAMLYKKLATLALDVPLAERLDDLAYRGTPRAEYEALCDRLGLRDLRTRPMRWR